MLLERKPPRAQYIRGRQEDVFSARRSLSWCGPSPFGSQPSAPARTFKVGSYKDANASAGNISGGISIYSAINFNFNGVIPFIDDISKALYFL